VTPAKLSADKKVKLHGLLQTGSTKAQIRKELNLSKGTVAKYSKEEIEPGLKPSLDAYKSGLISSLKQAGESTLSHIQSVLDSPDFSPSTSADVKALAVSLAVLIDKVTLLEQGPVNPVNAVALFLSPSESPTEQINLARSAIERSTRLESSLPDHSRPPE
tara:strand:- start:69 stop:551 length:483 start_codon:yes stop_codon:yes gene_type:complete